VVISDDEIETLLDDPLVRERVRSALAKQELDASALLLKRARADEFHARNCYGTSHYCVCR
jgi:hypothetical protein